MGYELSFYKNRNIDFESDEELWFCCGWDKLELFRALSDLAGKETFEDGCGVVLDVSRLHFLVELDEKVLSQSIYQVISALSSLDPSYVESLVAGLPEEMRAAMVLPFAGDDPAESAIRSFLAESALDSGSPWMISGMADAIRQVEAGGADEIIMFGG